MKSYLLLNLIFSLKIQAAEVVDSSENISPQYSSSAPYIKYLRCLNGLRFPIARNGSLTADDPQNIPDDKNTAIFAGNKNGRMGFFTLSPGSVTFDVVPIFEPTDAMPGYDLKIKQADGRMRYFHWYLTESGDFDAASHGGESMLEANKGVEFHELGSPDHRLPPDEATKNVIPETLKDIRSMPKVKDEENRFAELERRKLGKVRGASPWSDDLAKKALCTCVQTGNQEIIKESKAMAETLRLKDIETCDPYVSMLWLKNILAQLGNEAMASTKSRNIASLATSFPPRLIHLNDEEAQYCVGSKPSNINLKMYRISDAHKSCGKSDASSKVMTSNKFRAETVGSQIHFESL